MILASIEGAIVPAIIAGIVMLVRWLGERATKEAAKQNQSRGSVPAPQIGGSVKSQSEEERMRRFLEALGIPAEDAEAHRAPSPPPLRPAQEQRPGTSVPKSFPTVPPAKPSALRRQTSSSPKTPARTAVSAPVRRPSLDEQPAPVLPVEKIRIAELKTREVPEFETISSHVMAVDDEHFRVSDLVATIAGTHDSQEAPESAHWRTALKSPQAIRSAVILREVLGPPRGLQW